MNLSDLRASVLSLLKRTRPTFRQVLLTLALFGATACFASVIHKRYPPDEWLFWRYVGYWLYALLFASACVSVGHVALRFISTRPRHLSEHLALSFPLGLFAFYLGVFVFGLAGQLNVVFAFLWPLAMLGAGAVPLWRYCLPRLRRAVRLRARTPSLQSTWIVRVITLFGIANLALVYVSILSPSNVAYDSHWYHLAIAEHYAAGGKVGPFVEGWYHGTLPHLASFIYTWAFLVPGRLFDHIELAAHLEFVVLLGVLLGVGPLVRRLAPRVRIPAAWVAFFLFHEMLLQSNFGTGNDTFGALWAAPVFITMLLAFRRLRPGDCVLLACMLAGGISTKFQSISFVAFPVLAIAARALWAGSRRVARRPEPAVSWVKGPLAAVGASLLLTTPVWLKNWVWHGDPLYPFLYRHLPVHPWTEDSGYLVETVLKPELWKPQGTLWEGLRESLPVLLTFSFKPHDFPGWNGLMPLFGSLLTLSLPALLLLKAPRRVWALVAAIHAGIFAWYWSHHQDRYLIMLVPWMAAEVAIFIALTWRQGWLPRLGLLALVGLEVVWGADAPFLPIHPMVHETSLRSSIDLIQTGFRKNWRERYRIFRPWFDLRKRLPKGSRVLIHETRLHLGIGAMSVSDFGGGYQGGISYGRWAKPSRMYAELKRMGVTHVVWLPGPTNTHDSLAGDLMFYAFANRNLEETVHVGELRVGRMPAVAPSDEGWSDRVVLLGCGEGYKSGLYPVGSLTVAEPGKHSSGEYPEPIVPENGAWAFDEVTFVVNDRSCRASLPAAISAQFTLAATRSKTEYWIRKPAMEPRASSTP